MEENKQDAAVVETKVVCANQKLKIMYLMKILLEETDENHSIEMNTILKKLALYDISAERKSIYRDIETLRRFGLDIAGHVDSDRKYYYQVINREFELHELKLLVDAVQCSKFMTAKQSADLIDKLKAYVSKYQAEQMQRTVYVNGRVKSENERSYYSVDSIYEAIKEDKKISFYYFYYDEKKKKQYKHDKKLYIVSPFVMCWDDEKYYLIGYDETGEKPELKHFRVDKMEKTSILEEQRIGKDVFDAQDMGEYTNRMFGMFNTQVRPVELLCANNMANVIIDRFGMDVVMLKVDETHFKTRVNVAVSDLFFGWILALPDVKIIGPDDVVEQMKELLRKQIEKYK